MEAPIDNIQIFLGTIAPQVNVCLVGGRHKIAKLGKDKKTTHNVKIFVSADASNPDTCILVRHKRVQRQLGSRPQLLVSAGQSIPLFTLADYVKDSLGIK